MHNILISLAFTLAIPPMGACTQSPAPEARTVDTGLAQTVFARVKDIGEITDLHFGLLEPEGQPGLIVVGSLGYAVLDRTTGSVQRTVTFQSTGYPELATEGGGPFLSRVAIDLDGDGVLEFLTEGLYGGRVSLHGRDGAALWMLPGASAPFGTTHFSSVHAVDFDGDGVHRVLCLEHLDDAVLLDHKGKVLWKLTYKDGRPNSRGLAGPSGNTIFLDVNGDGKREILYVDGSAFVVRDVDWNVVKEVDLSSRGYVNALYVAASVEGVSDAKLFVGYHSKSGDENGQNYRLLDPVTDVVGEPVEEEQVAGLCIADAAGELGGKKFYAHIDTLKRQAWPAGYSASWLRLGIRDASHRLIHERILEAPGFDLPRSDGAVLFLPETAETPNRLLLAFGDTVWTITRP